jgi:hypothetical protein
MDMEEFVREKDSKHRVSSQQLTGRQSLEWRAELERTVFGKFGSYPRDVVLGVFH